MRKGPRKPTCSHGTEHWTPGGHCRVCDRDYRERVRAIKAAAALRRRAAPVAPKLDKEGVESTRTNRIADLIDAHWRAGTPWERAAIDEEIRKLSMQGEP